MGKIYLLFSLISFLTVHSFSQGKEDFTNNTATATYGDGSFVGNNAITWNFVHARNEGSFPINEKGIILRRGLEPSHLSATFSGGISNFSVNTKKAFRGNTKRKLELVINGQIIASHEPDFEAGEDTAVIPFVVNDINLPGEITLILRLYGATGNQQMTLDDLEWEGFTESLSITAPVQRQHNIKLFPNPPSSGFVKISSATSRIITIEVFDVLGKAVN
ncbi:MAG: hypothetical protein WA749_10520, partial [Gelidibacter sp.]